MDTVIHHLNNWSNIRPNIGPGVTPDPELPACSRSRRLLFPMLHSEKGRPFSATKEIGDVCTQARSGVENRKLAVP